MLLRTRLLIRQKWKEIAEKNNGVAPDVLAEEALNKYLQYII